MFEQAVWKWPTFKWTEEQVKSISWKHKSADEVLAACLAKWEHIRYRLTRGSELEFDAYATRTCPACAKWMSKLLSNKECSKCPLRSMIAEEDTSAFCCGQLWNTFSDDNSVENADAMLAFIAGRKYLVAKRRFK